MRTMTYSDVRQNLAATLDIVVNDRIEIIITRISHEPAVLMSLADYESLRETAYLLASPVNARRLLASVEALEEGRGEVRELVAE